MENYITVEFIGLVCNAIIPALIQIYRLKESTRYKKSFLVEEKKVNGIWFYYIFFVVNVIICFAIYITEETLCIVAVYAINKEVNTDVNTDAVFYKIVISILYLSTSVIIAYFINKIKLIRVKTINERKKDRIINKLVVGLVPVLIAIYRISEKFESDSTYIILALSLLDLVGTIRFSISYKVLEHKFAHVYLKSGTEFKDVLCKNMSHKKGYLHIADIEKKSVKIDQSNIDRIEFYGEKEIILT